MSWYVLPSKQLRDDELPPEVVVTNRNGSIVQVYEPCKGTCHDVSKTFGRWQCSECKRSISVALTDEPPRYCAGCGREVST